jgi:hypothetical protein
MSNPLHQACRRRGHRSGCSVRVRPYPITKGDEVGAGARQRPDLVRLRCIADAGNLDEIRPPHYPLFDGLERWPMAAPVGIPEHHVVGAGFAREHGIMTAAQTARAGDAIGL